MDIGTLTGEIDLEDNLSSTMSLIVANVKKFSSDIDDSLMTVALSVGAVVTAVAAGVTAIIGLGNKGSTILGVENAFDRLGEAVGSTGDVLFERLDKGLASTVDSMELMQTMMRPLTAGVKLTGDDMELLGKASREMGKATGTDATNGLQTLSTALTTGRTRGLAMAGITVDLTKAELEYANAKGVTVAQLSEVGKLEARRIAILDATRTYVDRLGESELTLKERMQQASVWIGNQFDSLAKSVAESPKVAKAYEDISNAITDAFGGSAEAVIDTVVGWIDVFAEAASTYGPPIIRLIGDIKDGIVAVWNTVKEAWSLVPDWFKNIAKEAALAGTAVYVTKGMFEGLTGSSSLLDTGGAIGGMVSGLKDLGTVIGGSSLLWPLKYLSDQIKIFGVVTGVTTTAQFLFHKSLTTTVGLLGWVGVAIGAVMAAWEIGKMEWVSDWFFDVGLILQGYTADQRAAMIATEKATQASLKRGASLEVERKGLEALMSTRSGSGAISTTPEEPSLFKSDAEDYAKKVQGLVEQVRQANIGLSLHADALAKTDEKYRTTKESLAIFLPEIERQIGLGRALTAIQRELYTTAKDLERAETAAGAAKLKKLGVSIEEINLLKAIGKGEAEIALAYGVTTTALNARIAAMNVNKGLISELTTLNSQLNDSLAVQAQKMRDLKFEEGKAKLDPTSPDYAGQLKALDAIRTASFQMEMTNIQTLQQTDLTRLQTIAEKETETYQNMMQNQFERNGMVMRFTNEEIDKQRQIAEAAQQAAIDVFGFWDSAMNGMSRTTSEVVAEIKTTLASLGDAPLGGVGGAGLPWGSVGPDGWVPMTVPQSTPRASNAPAANPSGFASVINPVASHIAPRVSEPPVVIQAQGSFFGASEAQVARALGDIMAKRESATSQYSSKR